MIVQEKCRSYNWASGTKNITSWIYANIFPALMSHIEEKFRNFFVFFRLFFVIYRRFREIIFDSQTFFLKECTFQCSCIRTVTIFQFPKYEASFPKKFLFDHKYKLVIKKQVYREKPSIAQSEEFTKHMFRWTFGSSRFPCVSGLKNLSSTRRCDVVEGKWQVKAACDNLH